MAKFLVVIFRNEFERTTDKVEQILKHNPETWAKYKDQPMKIVGMEIEELRTAREGRTHSELVKELLHVSAASAHAAHVMTCKE